MQGPTANAPRSSRVPTVRQHYGDLFADHHAWLDAGSSADVLMHLAAENEFTQCRTASLSALRENICAEIMSHTADVECSVPVRRGTFWYYTRTTKKREYAECCRIPVHSPDDWAPPDAKKTATLGEVILDICELAEGYSYFNLGSLAVSPDGLRVAVVFDIEGSERFTLRIRDLRTGTFEAEQIANIAPSVGWSADGQYLFYATFDVSWRPDTVWRHRVGSPSADDVAVLREQDDRYRVRVSNSRSFKFIMLELESSNSNEVRALASAVPEDEFRVIWRRRHGVQYFVDHTCVHGVDRFVITHNLGDDGLPSHSFAVVDVPVDDPTDVAILIDHREDIQVHRTIAFARYLVVTFRKNGLPALGTINVTATGYGSMSEIAPADLPRAINALGECAWEQPSPRIALSSITSPPRVLDVDATGTLLPIWTKRAPTGFDPSAYEARREWAVATDGTRVPISIFAKRRVLDRGPAPLFMASYGSYGISYDPSFDASLLSLVDRGVVVGIAHVRGGGECGRRWHWSGSAFNRVNAITDYLDCIKHLISRNVAERGRVVGSGKSAGGMIVGAAVNIDPGMFAGILARVPNVDPLTTMLNPTAPLTSTEWEEWGNPLVDKHAYDLMKSYSPYENVRAARYPAILATACLHDVRVSYSEPAKWVARLRESTTGDADILLKTDVHASHSGPSGHTNQCEQAAFEYAWVVDVLRLADQG